MAYLRIGVEKQKAKQAEERLRHAACEGKQQYASWSDANRVLQRMRKKSSYTEPAHPYHCQFCAFWHIGHSNN